MRRFVNERAPWLPAAALLAVLAAVPAATAQQPTAPATNPAGARKPARVEEEEEQAHPRKAVTKEAEEKNKTSLEDLLAEALKNNPDIRVADAKVQEAEAELNRTRLTVMQKVVVFYANRKAAQAKVEEAERRLARDRKLAANNGISQEGLQLAEQALRMAKAELELAEADMPSLLGKPPQKAVQGIIRPVGPASPVPTIMIGSDAGLPKAPEAVPEKIRKALDTPITVDFKDVPLADALDYLQDKTGVVIRNQLARYQDEANPKITLRFPEALPLRAVLQAVEDEYAGMPYSPVRFVVRDYGLLFVPNSAVPPGAVLVDQLGAANTGDKAPSAPAKNPPAANVEGVVKSVDQSGLVTISIGSDAGVAKGNTLEVFRLKPAKYLGTLRLVQVTAHEAVAQPAGRPVAPIQPGDHVASRILGQ